MTGSGFRRGPPIAIAAFLLVISAAQAQVSPDDSGGPQLFGDDQDLVLPDGRTLSELPISVSDRVPNDALRVVDWRVDLAVEGDGFEGTLTFPAVPVVIPRTAQGTRKGDIVEFFVRAEEGNVAYSAGHLAGTSLVGTFDGSPARRGTGAVSGFPKRSR